MAKKVKGIADIEGTEEVAETVEVDKAALLQGTLEKLRILIGSGGLSATDQGTLNEAALNIVTVIDSL